MPDTYTGNKTKTTTGGTGLQNKVISSFDDLSKVIPGYGNMTIGQIFASDVFTGPDAYLIDPQFFKELQGVMTTLESGYGVPVAQIPAGVFQNVDNLKAAVKQAGSGSTYHPQPYGYSAPDPLGAANAAMRAWEGANSLIAQGWDADRAFAQFQMDYMDLLGGQTRAEGSDRMQREISEANRRLGVAEEAGRRAQTLGRDYLPFMLPGAQSLNLPLIGNLPLTQVDPTKVFNQGGPGNLATLPSISPNPSVNYAPGPMPAFPQAPTFQGVPSSIAGWLQQAAAGSGPQGWA